MGYAKTSQTAHGIHLRLRSRAYIVSEIDPVDPVDLRTETAIKRTDDSRKRSLSHFRPKHKQYDPKERADPAKTICFVSIDAGMGSDLLNIRVLERLEELLPVQTRYGDRRLCHLENLSIR